MSEEAAMNTLERVVRSPLGGHLGLEPVEAVPDRVRIRLGFKNEITTVADQIHGGALAALIDTAATAVAWSGVDPQNPPQRGTTVSLSVHYLAAARGKDVTATATVAKRGRTLCFCLVEVHDSEGTLVARGDSVYKLG